MIVKHSKRHKVGKFNKKINTFEHLSAALEDVETGGGNTQSTSSLHEHLASMRKVFHSYYLCMSEKLIQDPFVVDVFFLSDGMQND